MMNNISKIKPLFLRGQSTLLQIFLTNIIIYISVFNILICSTDAIYHFITSL